MGKKTAIVTGGVGFIGSHMVDLLIREGFKVRIIDDLSGGNTSNINHLSNNPDLSLIERDIRLLEIKPSIINDVNYVFHFAGIGSIVPSIEEPFEYMDVNSTGTLRLLEMCKNTSIQKFVYAASSSCYGLAATPTSETHPIDTQHPYALSKYHGEQIALNWYKIYGIPVNSIRIFNAFGLRAKTTGAYGAVMGVFLKQKLEQQPFTVVGDGTQSRDFLYVTDVVEAFYKAAITAKVGEIWNLGAGSPQSVNRLVDLIGGDVVYIPKRPGEPDCTWANITKIKRDLLWAPSITFEEGVKLVIDNIENWRSTPLWDVQSIEKATDSWFKYIS
jgi:UDP-glucose 4-epimerase